MKQNKNNKQSIEELYLKANRRAEREMELERNGKWVAVDRPHKSVKYYDRKRNKRLCKDIVSNSI